MSCERAWCVFEASAMLGDDVQTCASVSEPVLMCVQTCADDQLVSNVCRVLMFAENVPLS